MPRECLDFYAPRLGARRLRFGFDGRKPFCLEPVSRCLGSSRFGKLLDLGRSPLGVPRQMQDFGPGGCRHLGYFAVSPRQSFDLRYERGNIVFEQQTGAFERLGGLVKHPRAGVGILCTRVKLPQNAPTPW